MTTRRLPSRAVSPEGVISSSGSLIRHDELGDGGPPDGRRRPRTPEPLVLRHLLASLPLAVARPRFTWSDRAVVSSVPSLVLFSRTVGILRRHTGDDPRLASRPRSTAMHVPFAAARSSSLFLAWHLERQPGPSPPAISNPCRRVERWCPAPPKRSAGATSLAASSTSTTWPPASGVPARRAEKRERNTRAAGACRRPHNRSHWPAILPFRRAHLADPEPSNVEVFNVRPRADGAECRRWRPPRSRRRTRDRLRVGQSPPIRPANPCS